MDWFEKQQRVFSPAPFHKQWSVKEKESILDYLHGDIPRGEVKACCYYEYARSSETLRKARREYDVRDRENSSLRVSNYFPGWIYGQYWFWQSWGYPDLPWRKLRKKQRRKFVIVFLQSRKAPVITDVLTL